MSQLNWSASRFDGRQATLLTLVFWAFTFVVFQAPALKVGKLTLWETTGYLVIVGIGVIFSLGLYLAIRRTLSLRLKPRLALIGLISLLAAVGHSAIDHGVFVASAKVFQISAPLQSLLDAFVFNILIYVWIYGLFATMIGLVITTFAMRDQTQRLAEARAAAQEAQLTALRFQINPHFLFNALNAVTALIGSGRNVDAEMVVVRLSEFFRASLTTAPGDLVRLDEEFDVVGSYLDIEAARFGDRMVVDIDLPDDLRGALAPHFILQPLVENAVKHGVARAKRTVTITVRATTCEGALVLTVKDDAGGSPHTAAANGTGVGLTNVSGRLRAFFSEAGSLRTSADPGHYTAEVCMPLKLEAAQEQDAA